MAIVYWQWFLPGPKVANDYPIISTNLLKSLMDFPYVWLEGGAEGLGEYSAFFLWSWPLSFITGVLANFDLGFNVVERTLLFIPFLLLGGIGIWKFCESINLTNAAKFIASLFYLTTTYILLVIDGGQLSIALSYAWFPIAFLAIEKSIKGGFNKKILAGLAVSILGFFDFRFIYILFLLSSTLFFYQTLLCLKKRAALFLDWISSGVIIGLVVMGLNAYWLLPLFKVPISPKTYAFFTQASFLSNINLGHSILLLAPHWFKNIFGNITALRPEFVFIPILVFLAPIFRPKNQVVGFWLLTAIFSVFLTKGASEPLGGIYPWLFSHIPGFSLFRDSTKFFFLGALSYSVLLGITTEEIFKKIIKFPKLKILFLFFLSSYFIFLARPVWLGQMTGTFAPPLHQQEFTKLSQFLEIDKNFSRIFWIPSFPSLGYSSQTHPRVEAARLVQRRPFNIGTKGTYETFNFLREAPFMGEIFDVAGIGYIVYPYLDLRRDNLHPDNIRYYRTFLKQLSERTWLTKVNSPIPLLKTGQHQDRFFITPNTWWVVGSDNIYNEATTSAKLKLSKNALIFAEEYPGMGTKLNDFPEAKVVLNSKTKLDLAAGFLNQKDLLFPAKNLDFAPNESGWWKREVADLIQWRSFLQEKYGIDNQDFDLGGGWAVGEGSLNLKIQSEKLKKENVLLARVMESSRSGSLSFYQDGQTVGSIPTKVNKDTNIRWFEVGKLNSDKELTIVTNGDINVVNVLAILSEDDWKESLRKAKEYQDQGRIFDYEGKNTENNIPNVTYQQVNPTKYKVSIRGLKKPAFLVFSQNFDGLWVMGKQKALPVYSLLNGFRIETDGDYVVEFKAQKHVYPGLIITGLTVSILLFFLIKFR